jgi:hypothetical protein
MSLQSRLIALFVGIFLLYFIFNFLRKRILNNFYALLWITISALFIIIAVYPDLLEFIARIAGIDFTPLAIVAFFIFFLIAIVFHITLIISDHNRKIREFEKEISFLKEKKNK